MAQEDVQPVPAPLPMDRTKLDGSHQMWPSYPRRASAGQKISGRCTGRHVLQTTGESGILSTLVEVRYRGLNVKRNLILALAALVVLTVASSDCFAGGGVRPVGPPIDQTLTGMKEQGVWYFPCVAPIYRWRIPPQYATYAPPPPPCMPPVQCAPPPRPLIKVYR